MSAVLLVVAGVVVVGAGVGTLVVGGVNRDVVVVVAPLMGEVVLERGEGFGEDAVGRRAGVDARVGDVDLVAVLVRVGAVGMVAVLRAAREDEGDAGRLPSVLSVSRKAMVELLKFFVSVTSFSSHGVSMP